MAMSNTPKTCKLNLLPDALSSPKNECRSLEHISGIMVNFGPA